MSNIMKPAALALLLLGFLTITSTVGCKEDETSKTNLDVTFQATFDGERFINLKNYNLGGTPVQFSRFDLYISDLTLLKADGTEVRLTEVDFLDFSPDNSTSDMSPLVQRTFKDVPEGEYSALRIGYGVKSDLNRQRPSNFAVGHPLSNESHYWSGWQSYIFTKIEGGADADNNGSLELGLTYHFGSDAIFKTFQFDHTIHVHPGEPSVQVDIDLKKIFTLSDGTMYDIKANSKTHSDPSNVTVAQSLSSNMGKATAVQQ